MSEEAVGWQRSRCALKKPWRLAEAYPNLCRRQISPGSLRRPQCSLLASNKPDAEWTSTWPFVNPGPWSRHLDTITLTRAPRRVSISRVCLGKEKNRKEKGSKAGSWLDVGSFVSASLSWK
jgi:hypothetical protein